jgi:integrase
MSFAGTFGRCLPLVDRPQVTSNEKRIDGRVANAGHDTRALQAYLGHRNIQHTVRYTELAPNRFKDFWR